MCYNVSMRTNNDHDGHEQGGVLYNDKTVWFYGDITVQSASNFAAAMEQADRKPGRITVNICSNGGWVEGGLAMHDAITCAKNEVVTIGSGAVYSSAILPFEAGDIRLLYPSARIFFHDMSISMGGVTAKSAIIALKETEALYTLYCDIVAKRTGLSYKEVHKFCQDETYIDADVALLHRLIDDIIIPQPKFKVRIKKK